MAGLHKDIGLIKEHTSVPSHIRETQTNIIAHEDIGL